MTENNAILPSSMKCWINALVQGCRLLPDEGVLKYKFNLEHRRGLLIAAEPIDYVILTPTVGRELFSFILRVCEGTLAMIGITRIKKDYLMLSVGSRKAALLTVHFVLSL